MRGARDGFLPGRDGSKVALEEERDLAFDSLRLLDDELSEGRLDPGEYQLLADEATARAAAAIRGLERLGGGAEGVGSDGHRLLSLRAGLQGHQQGGTSGWRSGTTRRKRRRSLLWGGMASLGAAMVIVVASYSTPRLPGRPITGSLKLTASQRLAQQLVQGRVLVSEGHYRTALGLFRTILHDHPGQPEALAYEGWLLVLAGHGSGNRRLMDTGRSDISKSVSSDPTYPDGHLLLGVALYSYYGDLPDALIQFRLFLADHPSQALVSAATPTIDAAFAKAGVSSPVSKG